MDIEVVLDPAARLAADAALAAQIDALGARSAVAQGLHRVITSTALFASHLTAAQISEQTHRQQTLFIARDAAAGDAIGYLKTGSKHLFYVNRKGVYTELEPLCVLDFFVADTHQRTGVGLELFRTMLQTQQVTPAQLAYDRPSPKLFAFLRKHCALVAFFPQPNNFVVFDDFFAEGERGDGGGANASNRNM